jgi:hypothetical protein
MRLRRALVVLAVLVVVAGAFTAGALIFRDGGDEGWSQADEKKWLDVIVEENFVPNDYDDVELEDVETWAACVLEVYEEYFSSYDDYDDASDDSPTLLKADAAAQRKCKV